MANGSGWLVQGGRGRTTDTRLRDRLSSLERPTEPDEARAEGRGPTGPGSGGKRDVGSGSTGRGTRDAAGGRARAGDPLRQRARSVLSLGGIVREDGLLITDRSVAELTSLSRMNRLLSRFRSVGRRILARGDVHEDVRGLLADPAGALFIDTETTGLAGSVVFLLGAMRVTTDDVRLVQVFARDYSEEFELAQTWGGMLASASRLVSFNGKSFDVPVLRDRLGYHAIEEPETPPHLDLLHHARRRWGDRLPDCRLQTLERELCGRKRAGDIPGDEIPGVYHHYVKTGEEADILTVFHHNALDIMTLADIALALAEPEDGPA
jgi:uncharacterized protein YprB with RNaseH-like and TPR domain